MSCFMIPKILHYVWLGPYQDNRTFFNDWLSVMPEYTLKIWNNDTASAYLEEMIELFGGLDKLKNTTFTFVSDVIRLLILRDHGGVYLDHDMCVIKDFTELLDGKNLALTFYFDPANKHEPNTWGTGDKVINFTPTTWGGANYNSDTVNNCFIAATPNNPIIDRMLELTVENHFKDESEQFAMSDWGAGPAIASAVCKELGLNIADSETVEKDGVIVYHRNLLHPVHGVERSKLGPDQYYELANKLIDEANSYAVHMHDNCGTDLYLTKKLTFFDEWYTNR